MADPIYLDYNGTTPVDTRVVDAMIPYLRSHFGNPSSGHTFGVHAKEAIETARKQVAACVGAAANPSQITFTSGGTECINYVLKGATQSYRSTFNRTPHVITAATEHVATLETVRFLQAQEALPTEVTILAVDNDGRINVQDVVDSIRENTVLVTLMHANNETGVIQPIQEICSAIKKKYPDRQILVHCDASQSVGKVPIDVNDLGVDYLTIAGHKVYAPKGIGALFIREGTPRLTPLIHGAGQENGLRAGTENVSMSAGLGVACEIAADELRSGKSERLAFLRDWLQARLSASSPVPVHVNSGNAPRLPNTLSIGFKGIRGSDIVHFVKPHVACSAGAACHSGHVTVSHFLAAMGVPEEFAVGTIRLTVGRYTTEEEVDAAAEHILITVAALLEQGAAKSQPSAGTFDRTERVYLNDTYQFEHEGAIIACVHTAEHVASAEGKEVLSISLANGEVVQGPSLPFPSVCITDSTIFHPQGGGQPGDQGLIYTHAARPLVFAVLTTRASLDGRFVLHYGRVISSEQLRAVLASDASLQALLSAAKALGDEPSAAATDGSTELPGAGTAIKQLIDANWRTSAARLHSAGHLLDAAMSNIGYGHLEAGKGYHFPDMPFVEYEGDVPSGEREGAAARLQAECDRIVSLDIPTRKIEALPSSGELQAIGLAEAMYAHLPSDKPVRALAVGGESAWCPCGGTHVRSSSELAGLRIEKLRVKKKRVQVRYSMEPLVLTEHRQAIDFLLRAE